MKFIMRLTIILHPTEMTATAWTEPVLSDIRSIFVRSPFKTANLKKVYQQLCSRRNLSTLIWFTAILPWEALWPAWQLHTTGTGPVIYTAHGFHFFFQRRSLGKLSSVIIPWNDFFPFTDQQICINQEDFACASKQFHARYTDYIPEQVLTTTACPI